MTRTLSSFYSGLALALLSLPLAAADPPNILIVSVDDVGVDQLAVYDEAGACSTSQTQCFSAADCPGAETCVKDYPFTPTIDQLAAEGVLFRNAWAAQSCEPARAAGMTGRYALRTGVYNNAATLASSERTIAEALKDSAIVPQTYQTGAFGKWSFGGVFDPQSQGFDHFAGTLGNGIGNYFSWSRTVNGVTNTCSLGSAVCPTVAYSTTVNVNDALDWLAGATEPFFMWFAFNAPHSPFHVPPHGLLSAGTLAKLPTDGMGDPQPEGTGCSGANRRVCYQAMLEAADTELSRLIAAMPPDTWIVILGDNGTPRAIIREPFDDTRGKGSIYEGGINVPMLVRAPDTRSAGEETAAHVHIVDLFATAVDLAGGTMPTDRAYDGLSVVPLVSDPSLTARAIGYAETPDGETARDERFKLIRLGASDELYDLEGDASGVGADPFETTDLLLAPLSPEASAARDALSDLIVGMASPSGRVPDGKALGGTPLDVSKAAAGELSLSWGASCGSSDTDYSVYEGPLGDYAGHGPATCSTGGATSANVTPQPGSRWFVIVPSNGAHEGSYGTRSDSLPRAASNAACLPQAHAGCD